MGRRFGGREVWVRISNRFRLVQSRQHFCTDITTTTKVDRSSSQYDKIDFITAAKILFTTPPNNNKFGIDFHLVQLFFVCMPSLAVYLVAQYARHEMRRMEAELELKKRGEEEANAKEIELKAAEENEAGSDPDLLGVKVRLGKLEETVKDIVVKSKKQSGSTITKNLEDDNEKKQVTTPLGSIQNRSLADNFAAEDHLSKQTSKGRTGSCELETSGSDASQKDQKAIQDGGPSQEEKK